MGANGALPKVTRTFPVFEKKAQDKDIFLWKSVQPSLKCWHLVYKWSSKVYFPEACKRQTAIKKLANLLPIANVCLQYKSTFAVHYRRGSPGQLGLPVAGFPGTGSLGHKMWPSSMPSILLRCKWPFGPFAFNKLTDWLNWHQLSGLRRH